MNTAENANTAAPHDDGPPSPGRATVSSTPPHRAETERVETVQEQPNAVGKEPAEIGASQNRRRYLRISAIIAVLAVGLAVGIYYWQFMAPYESTDDAFIEANVTMIAPQVAGRVVRLRVDDNQEVRQGDVLLEIDPSDYQAKLDQARANLAAAKSQLEQANAQLAVDQAKVGEEKANVAATEAEAKRAATDLKRYQAVGPLAVSQSQLDLAAAQGSSAAAGVQVARSKELAAEARVSLDNANLQTAAAEIQRNAAAVRQAELDLSYTRVTAPVEGRVTARTVEPGAYVQPGQALLTVVPQRLWVVANFKETQLAHMRPGQPVNIRVDAYPQLRLKGKVDSLQKGSGARFSLLPPENAVGNYVKVVQRVPVKIVFDQPLPANLNLAPGMSAEPEVRIR